MSLVLYSYWRSSASYRVRIALALKGLAYEYVPVQIYGGVQQQYDENYRRLNPQSRVPLLVDGDLRIAQSLAILDYLEQRHPQPALVPVDSAQRARMQTFCQTIAADIQPLQNLGPLAYLTRHLGASEEQKNAWIRHWIERGLAVLEQDYSAQAGDWVIGDTPTWADCLLVPQVYNAERFGCDVAKFPRLYDTAQRCREHAAFRAAHPDRQPDVNPG